jgi:hypothetical protein
VRVNTFGGVGKKYFYPVLKAPRQCPLVILVEVHLREGKALGSQKVVLGILCYEQKKEVEPGFYCA